MHRWSRQTILPELGIEGQLRLKNATVLCIGTGALGSPAALYLAAAGIGKIVIVDPDVVERSNLQRQIIHSDAACGTQKVDSAAARLRELNPEIIIETHAIHFTPDNAIALSTGCDVIVDGSDNFPTRFLTNDAAFFQKIPLVHGAIQRFEGQMTVFAPHLGGPCYRCLLPQMPAPGSVPSCAEAGVIGALPGIIGSMQAMETLKLIAKMGKPAIGTMVCYDALNHHSRHLTLRADPHCALCGSQPSIFSVHNPETISSTHCSITSMKTITVQELHAKITAGDDFQLIDVREPDEYIQAAIAVSKLIPLGSIPARLSEIDPAKPVIIHCKSGGRSARAAQFLLENGYRDVTNVTGGMDAWLDAALPTADQ